MCFVRGIESDTEAFFEEFGFVESQSFMGQSYTHFNKDEKCYYEFIIEWNNFATLSYVCLNKTRKVIIKKENRKELLEGLAEVGFPPAVTLVRNAKIDKLL